MEGNLPSFLEYLKDHLVYLQLLVDKPGREEREYPIGIRVLDLMGKCFKIRKGEQMKIANFLEKD